MNGRLHIKWSLKRVGQGSRLALAGRQVALGDKTYQNATETEFRGAILVTDNLLTIHRHIYIK